MRSYKIQLTVPHRLWDAYEKLAPTLGYADAKQMLIWCPAYCFKVPTPHILTGPIGSMSREHQDEVIEAMVSAWEAGPAATKSFFERFITELLRRLGVTATLDTLRAVIADVWKSFRKPNDGKTPKP